MLGFPVVSRLLEGVACEGSWTLGYLRVTSLKRTEQASGGPSLRSLGVGSLLLGPLRCQVCVLVKSDRLVYGKKAMVVGF